MVAAVAVFCLSTMQTSAFAQDSEGLPSLTEDNTPSVEVKSDPKSVFLLICESNPEQLCVLDSSGSWISDVRSAKINFTIGSTKPQIECTMWAGPFKPSSPRVSTWDLIQIKSVSQEKFQTVIDSLQNDSAAVRKLISNNNL